MTHVSGKRIDGLFAALQDEQTRLEAVEDIRSLGGRIVVAPGQENKADLWLEGDLASILTLAAGKKIRPESACFKSSSNPSLLKTSANPKRPTGLADRESSLKPKPAVSKCCREQFSRSPASFFQSA